MKNILAILIVLITVNTVTFARRADRPSPVASVAVMKTGTTFRLFYKGSALTDVKVSIFDAHDNVVFTEMLRKVDSFIRPYNFSGLQEGEYTIEVIDGTSLQVKKLNYTMHKVENLLGLVRLSGEKGKFLLTVPNEGKETLTISIFNSNGTLLYKAQEQSDGDFSKIYNVKRSDEKLLFMVTDKKGNSNTISY